MNTKHVKIMAAATVAYWFIMLGAQIIFVITQLSNQEALVDEQIGAFARRYLLTSSLQIMTLFLLGTSLAVIVYTRKIALVAVALAGFSAFCLWRSELSALYIFFRPPLGDGTLVQAAVGWLRLNSNNLPLVLFRICFLTVSIPFWSFAFDTLRQAPPDSKSNTVA